MTTITTTTDTTFADLGVRDEIVRALEENGITHPFAIQELTLPLALAGDDLIGQARTGMGKTFAFGVPLLDRITRDADRPLTGIPRALVVVPTRELCLQVYGDLATAAKYLRVTNEDGSERKLSVTSIYGGRPYEPQIEALQKGVDVVVGTPGRLLDLAQQGHLQLGGLSALVLDEADEMLDLGFLPDIERILKQIPDKRQAMLFSATMPDPIITLARTFMTQPTHIRAEAPHSAATHDTTKQFAYRAHALDKVEMVSRILQAEGRGATMIFTRTKRTAQKVADELGERGFKVGAVHGDLGQGAREKALKAFRTGEVDVLVATDVAARGIDIDDITHVINFQIPEDEQSYVHRIGRTGRAGKTGIAVTLVDWDELPRWAMIDKALGLDTPEPAETYSSSPHLYTELDIPESATGSIGKATRSADSRDKGTREPREPRERNRSRTRQRTRRRWWRERRLPRAGTAAPSASQAQHRGAHCRLVALRWIPSLRTTKPERRTKVDLLVAAAIVVVIAVCASLIWWTSDARATMSRPAATPVPGLKTAREVPAALRQLWTAPSPKTDIPVIAGGSVVTGDGRQIDGRDPATGDVLWSYARDRDLCGVTSVYYDAVAVYPDDRGCGQVTTISGTTGDRGATRSGYADKAVRLSTDGSTVLAYGDTRLEQWRSDMVRMLSWGALDAPIKPKVPVLPICRLVSAAASSSAVSVIESCPDASEPRLTLLRADKQEDEPLTKYVPLKGVPNDDSARVIAVYGTSTAVYLPTPKPTVNVIDETGATIASTALPKPVSPQAISSMQDDVITWWTGDSVMVFEANGLRYRYTVSPVGGQAPVGPAAVMAGKLLVPVTTGYDVFDAETGTGDRHIDLERPAGPDPVIPAVADTTVLEQRGDELVALGG